MQRMRKKLACCRREREISLDLDEQERVMIYNGLESCILNSHSYENESRTSRGDAFASDSLDDDFSSCSSSKDAFSSFCCKGAKMKRDEEGSDEWEPPESPPLFDYKKKPAYASEFSDVEEMKEKFAKLLLGEDITGGCKGVSTALALSNAIANLAASIFGELWKLEPLPKERKNRWYREMDWLLSPANHMVELVPAKQNGANGRILEIMTPKARADIQMNLPALRKLDSMLIETLDSMVNTEFWYSEVGSRAEGRNKTTKESKRWWLPLPQVPRNGLSECEKRKLLSKAKVVHQVFKAAKAINENVLLEMPVPLMIRDAFSKFGKANLGDDLYKALTAEFSATEDLLISLGVKSEHGALEAVNKLEAAVFGWKEKITEQISDKSPIRTSWSLIKDPRPQVDKIELLLVRAEALLLQIKSMHPNLPQTFLDSAKVQHSMDVGHSILEAYSRVLGNLAFSLMSRIGEILQEDALSNLNSPPSRRCFGGVCVDPDMGSGASSWRTRQSLLDEMNKADVRCHDSSSYSDVEFSNDEAKGSSVSTTPSRSRVWCIGKEACRSMSPGDSP